MSSSRALEPVFGGSISALDVENEIKRNGCLQQIISLASDSKLGKPLSKSEKAKLEKLVALLAQEMLETRLFTRGWELAARNAEEGYSAGTTAFQTGKCPRPEEEDGNTLQKRAKPQTLSQTTRQYSGAPNPFSKIQVRTDFGIQNQNQSHDLTTRPQAFTLPKIPPANEKKEAASHGWALMGLKVSEGRTPKIQNGKNGDMHTLPTLAPGGSVKPHPNPDASASQSQQTYRGNSDMSEFRGKRSAYPTQTFPIIPKTHVPSSEVWNLPQFWEQAQISHNGGVPSDGTFTQLPQQSVDQVMFFQDGGIPCSSTTLPPLVHQNLGTLPQQSLEQAPVFHGTYPPSQQPTQNLRPLPQPPLHPAMLLQNGQMPGGEIITHLPQQTVDRTMFPRNGGMPGNTIAQPVHQNREPIPQQLFHQSTVPQNGVPREGTMIQPAHQNLRSRPQQLVVPRQPVNQKIFLQNGGASSNTVTQPIDRSTVVHKGGMPDGGTTPQPVHQNAGPLPQQSLEQAPASYNAQMSGDGTLMHLPQQPVIAQQPIAPTQPIVPQQPVDQAIFLQNGEISSYGAQPQASRPGPGTGQDNNRASRQASTATVPNETEIINSNDATHPQPPLNQLGPEPVIQHGQQFEEEMAGKQVVEPNLAQPSGGLLVPEMPSGKMSMASFGLDGDLGLELDDSMSGIEADFWGQGLLG